MRAAHRCPHNVSEGQLAAEYLPCHLPRCGAIGGCRSGMSVWSDVAFRLCYRAWASRLSRAAQCHCGRRARAPTSCRLLRKKAGCGCDWRRTVMTRVASCRSAKQGRRIHANVCAAERATVSIGADAQMARARRQPPASECAKSWLVDMAPATVAFQHCTSLVPQVEALICKPGFITGIWRDWIRRVLPLLVRKLLTRALVTSYSVTICV